MASRQWPQSGGAVVSGHCSGTRMAGQAVWSPGMAAATAVFRALLIPGDHVGGGAEGDVTGPCGHWLGREATRMGLRIDFVATRPGNLPRAGGVISGRRAGSGWRARPIRSGGSPHIAQAARIAHDARRPARHRFDLRSRRCIPAPDARPPIFVMHAATEDPPTRPFRVVARRGSPSDAGRLQRTALPGFARVRARFLAAVSRPIC